MNNHKVGYPKNWYESNNLVKNLEKELVDIYNSGRGKKRVKEYFHLIRATRIVLDELDNAIANCCDSRELKNLTFAKEVLTSWMRTRKIPEIR